MLLDHLLNFIPSDTEERVRRTRERFIKTSAKSCVRRPACVYVVRHEKPSISIYSVTRPVSPSPPIRSQFALNWFPVCLYRLWHSCGNALSVLAHCRREVVHFKLLQAVFRPRNSPETAPKIRPR